MVIKNLKQGILTGHSNVLQKVTSSCLMVPDSASCNIFWRWSRVLPARSSSLLEPRLHGMFLDEAAFALHSIGDRLNGFGLHIEVIKHNPAAAGGGR